MMNKAAGTVIAIWNGNTSRKNLERELLKFKLRRLFRRLFINITKNCLSKAGDVKELLARNLPTLEGDIEIRKATNNMLQLANNIVRNAILYRITNDKSFLDSMSYKKEYFRKWRLYSSKYDANAKIVQSKYRQFEAKKKLQIFLKIKEKLLKIMLRSIETDKQRLYVALLAWKVKVDNMLVNGTAKTLQDYIRKNLIRKRLTKTQAFFKKGENSLFKNRFLFFTKMVRLRRSIVLPLYKQFFKLFKSGNRRALIRNALLKRYYVLDDKLRNVYLAGKLKFWHKQAHIITEKIIESATIIQSFFRRFRMRKLLSLMIDKQRKHLKLVLKLTNQMDIKRAVYFQLWKKLAMDSKYKHAANVLTIYMKDIQDRIAKKRSYIKFKLNAQGLTLVRKVFNDRALKFYNKLRLFSKYKRSINLLNFIIRLKESHESFAISRIIKQAEEGQNRYVKKVNIIQEMYRMYKQRTGLMRLFNLYRKMRFIFSLCVDKQKRYENKCFKLWKRNTLGDMLNYSARILQRFINYRILRKKMIEKRTAMKFIKLMTLRRRNKDFSDLKNLKRVWMVNQAFKRQMFERMRAYLDLMEKMKYLNKLFRLPKTAILRILKKWIFRWKEITEKLSAQEYFDNENGKRRQMIRDILEKKLRNLHDKYLNKGLFYIRLWSGKIRDKTVQDAVMKIQSYIDRKMKDLKARRKWVKLFLGLCIKNHKYHMLHINDRIKQLLRFRRIFNLFSFKINTLGFNYFKLKVHLYRIHKKLLIVFNNTSNAEKNITTLHYWKRWRHTHAKLRQRDRSLNKTNELILIRQKIDDLRILNNAFLIKRMMVLFKVIWRRRAFDKLKIKSIKQQQHTDLGKVLSKSHEDVKTGNKCSLVEDLFRMFTFRLLQNTYKWFNSHKKKKLKDHFAAMRTNIDLMFHNRSKFNYNANKKVERVNNYVRQFKFTTKNIRQKDKDVETSLTKNQLQYVMPFYVKFMESLIRKRKKYSIDKMKPLYHASKLIESVNTQVQKFYLKEKKSFVEELLKRAEIQRAKQSLKKSFRKYTLSKLRDLVMIPTSKLLKLLYVIRVIILHNNNSNDTFASQIVKRWCFMAHVKKISKQKLQVIYKNMHLSYLSVAEEIFGTKEDDNNPSLVDDITGLTQKLGLGAPKDRETPRAKKKYVFDDLIVKDDSKPAASQEPKEEEEKKNDEEVILDNPPKRRLKAGETSPEKSKLPNEVRKTPPPKETTPFKSLRMSKRNLSNI